LGPMVHDLRRELYGVAYDQIDFAAHRQDVAVTDLFVRPRYILRLASRLLSVYEHVHVQALRRRALDFCLRRILYEQRTSRYQGLSPVNALLNCLVLHADDRDNAELHASLDGLESWKFEDDQDGRRYAGARSQTWDTAFAMQALLANPEAARRAALSLRRAYAFLRRGQLTE